MEKIKFKIVLSGNYKTTAPHAEVSIGNQIVFDAQVTDTSFISYTGEFENEGDHQLLIKLKNKQPEHTVVDDKGNIVKDSLLEIKQVIMEDIEVHNSFSLDKEKFYYEHSGQRDTLYNTLGVNGQAVINFTTPFYVWLLETI